MRTEVHNLWNVQHMWEDLAAIAFDAVGVEHDKAMAEIAMYATRNAGVVLAYEEDELAGYVIYGPSDKFIPWSVNMRLFIKIRKAGIKELYTICHLHLKKKYWGSGRTKELSIAYSRAILAEGGTHLFLHSYATDDLAAFALSRPGSRKINGEKDAKGRQVGVRDIKEYVQAAG